MRKLWRGQFVVYLVVLLIAAAALLPVVYGAIAALSPDGRTFVIDPSRWTTENYSSVFSQDTFWHSLINSMIVATTTTIVSILVAVPAAYVLTRAGRSAARYAVLFLAVRMIPGLALVLPMYSLYLSIGLMDTQVGLIASYLTFGVPLAVWMIQGFFAEIPTTIDEAAALDGAGHVSIMWRVLAPISAGGILSTAVLLFVFCWNEFLFALILTTSDAMTFLPLLTRYVLPDGPLYGQIFAGSTVFLLPPMFGLFLIRSRLSEAFSLGGIH